MRSIYLLVAVSVVVILAEPVYENTFCELILIPYVYTYACVVNHRDLNRTDFRRSHCSVNFS